MEYKKQEDRLIQPDHIRQLIENFKHSIKKEDLKSAKYLFVKGCDGFLE